MSDIDPEKLREAIEQARKRVAYETSRSAEYAGGPSADQHRLLADVAEWWLTDNPPPAPKDHVIVVFTRATGTVEFFKSLGDVLMTKDVAMERAQQWSHDYPDSTYTVLQVDK